MSQCLLPWLEKDPKRKKMIYSASCLEVKEEGGIGVGFLGVYKQSFRLICSSILLLSVQCKERAYNSMVPEESNPEGVCVGEEGGGREGEICDKKILREETCV